MPTVNPSPFGPKPQFVDAAGNPDVGYKLFAYIAGSTSTKQNTYTNSTGSVANANPQLLNLLGQTPNEFWFAEGQLYKIVLAPATDTDPPTNPIWTIDNLQGINDSSGATNVDQWQLFSSAGSFINTTTFSLVGNQTDIFHIGRRVQLSVTSGLVYGRITNSVFAAVTTVTLQMDGSQVLDSGLSAVYYSLLSNNVLSLPERIATATGTNIYSATVGIARLVLDDEYKIKIQNANTGAATPTLTLDVGGALPIQTQNGSTPLPGMLNGEHKFRYNGSAQIVLNPNISTGVPRAYLAGLTMSTAGASTTMTVSPGTAADSTNVVMMNLGASISKTTAVWAVGTGVGGLDTGVIANTTWYTWYEILRPDTGVVDIIYSLNATTPALPANYLYYRRIGSGFTNGSAQWTKFIQDGDLVQWDVPVLDVNINNPGTAAVLRTLSVPLGVSVQALFKIRVADTGITSSYLFTDPAVSDVAPVTGSYNDATANVIAGTVTYGPFAVRTNTASQVRSRASASGASTALIMATYGYIDSRGKNA